MITVGHYVTLAAALFCVGLYGVMTSRSMLRVIVCVELMLNAVNLTIVALALHSSVAPQAGLGFVIFLIAVGAAEVGLALALVVVLSRSTDITAIDSLRTLRG